MIPDKCADCIYDRNVCDTLGRCLEEENALAFSSDGVPCLPKHKEQCFSYCRRHGTMECPNSFFCYATDDKPYFELEWSKVRLRDRVKIRWMQLMSGLRGIR